MLMNEPKKKGNPNRTKKATKPATPKAEAPKTDNADVLKVMEDMQKRMTKLEQENQDLKGQVLPEKHDPKKHHDGAKHFSYKMRGGIPVCSYVSKRKDATRDLRYSDGKGGYIDNHLAVLTLADGEKVEVLMNDFGKHCTPSEKQLAVDHNGEEIFQDTMKRVKHYTFQSDKYGSFNVLPNSING